MTDDSAFKKQVRARMTETETGENYTTARRTVIAAHNPGQPPLVLRVYLNPHVDMELTVEAARAFEAADKHGRQEMAVRLLADQIEVAGSGEAPVAAAPKIVTDQELRADAEAAEDAAIRSTVQRAIERTVGISTVEVGRAADRLRVDIRAARPILVAGQCGAEADRLRGELEELTGRQVRLDIREAPGPKGEPGSGGPGHTAG